MPIQAGMDLISEFNIYDFIAFFPVHILTTRCVSLLKEMKVTALRCVKVVNSAITSTRRGC